MQGKEGGRKREGGKGLFGKGERKDLFGKEKGRKKEGEKRVYFAGGKGEKKRGGEMICLARGKGREKGFVWQKEERRRVVV